MPENKIESNQRQFLIQLNSPSRACLSSAYHELQQWTPDVGARLCIKINLSDDYLALMVRAMLLSEFVAALADKQVLFELAVSNATSASLKNLFKLSKSGKKLPPNLSIYCDRTTASKVWVDTICSAIDEQRFSDNTSLYINFPMHSDDRLRLDTKVYAEIAGTMTVRYASRSPRLRRLSFFEVTQQTPVELIEAVDTCNPHQLKISFDAEKFNNARSIIDVCKRWKPSREAVFSLNVLHLNPFWSHQLEQIFSSETCDMWNTKNIAFSINFQRARATGLLAFFTKDLKLPRQINFICDNTTYTGTWYDAILLAIHNECLSEYTLFDMGFHKLSPKQVFYLTQQLKSPLLPHDLVVRYHVGRSRIKTLQSIPHSEKTLLGDEFALGYLPTIYEVANEEETEHTEGDLNRDMAFKQC